MSRQERLLDLLAARATEGLGREESQELEGLIVEQSDLALDDLDLAAAELDLAFRSEEGSFEPMPREAKRKVLDRAEEFWTSRGDRTVVPFPERSESGSPGRRLLSPAYLGWYAAAALLVFSVWSWSLRPVPPAPATAPVLTVTEQRALLLEQAGDAIRVAWAPSEIAGYEQVSGDVVWSNERQRGYMRLVGLPANRSDAEQYQLWIVDPSRDERPIDGGVFDVPAGARESIVPIDAKLRVDDPRIFAITLEKVGGVVVSDGPLLVVAPIEA